MYHYTLKCHNYLKLMNIFEMDGGLTGLSGGKATWGMDAPYGRKLVVYLLKLHRNLEMGQHCPRMGLTQPIRFDFSE